MGLAQPGQASWSVGLSRGVIRGQVVHETSRVGRTLLVRVFRKRGRTRSVAIDADYGKEAVQLPCHRLGEQPRADERGQVALPELSVGEFRHGEPLALVVSVSAVDGGTASIPPIYSNAFRDGLVCSLPTSLA